MSRYPLAVLVFLLVAAPSVAQAQYTAPGAPLQQGQQRHPDTTVAPSGSAPAATTPNGTERHIMSASDIAGAEVINEFGESVGTVRRLVEGDGGLNYAVVTLDGEEGQVVFPIMLMGAQDNQLVVRGYGRDMLRAQRIDNEALAAFSEIHPDSSIALPRVQVRQQSGG